MQALAAGQALSGEALAARLGVTRAAVWKQVAALRAQGLPIEADPGSGYRLPWPLQLLELERIAAAVDDDVAAPVHLHWELDSTQDELARRLPELRDLTVVLAERQTLGRGRRGRSWHSAPGLALTLSCLKRFAVGPAALSGLSIAMGVCVVQALQTLGVEGPRIKWPNDLVVDDAKLAGILIEIGGEYEGPCVARVGLGLNLRLPADAHDRLGQAATDLAALCGGTPPERNRLAAQVIGQLRRGLLRFEREGLAAFAEDFGRLDALAGRPLTVQGAQGVEQGVGRGIDAQGALRVQTPTGLIVVHGGEVSVRTA